MCVCAEVPIGTGRILHAPTSLSKGVPVKPSKNDDEELSWGPRSRNGAFKCSAGRTVRLSNQLLDGDRESWRHHLLHSSSDALISLGQGRSGLIGSRDVFRLQGLIFTPSCKLKPFFCLICPTDKCRPEGSLFFPFP